MKAEAVQKQIHLQDENYFDFLNGLWTGKKPPFTKAVVIRNTNFSNDGKVDYSDIAVLDVEVKQLAKRKLQKGDIIIERSGGGPKQPVGRVVYFEKDCSDIDYSFSNFTSVIRIKDKTYFDSRFVFYYLYNFYLEGKTDQLQRRTTGIRNLDYNAYKESVILPPFLLTEQKSISRVLATIQEAIAGQEELISKLKELKRGMMQHLFTHGTKGEQTKLTEIGEVPESWEVVMLGKIADIQQGKQVSKKNRIGNNQKPFLRTANIFWNKIDLSVLDKMNFSLNEEKKFKLNYGDLLVCEGGAVGRTSMWKDEMSDCYYQNHLHKVRVNENMDSSFLLYWLNYALEFTEIYFGRANNTTIPNLAKSKLQQFEIPFPDIKEQNNISSILISIDQKIESVQDKLLVYQNLFNTLLHELMSGERRVNN